MYAAIILSKFLDDIKDEKSPYSKMYDWNGRDEYIRRLNDKYMCLRTDSATAAKWEYYV